jgi:Pyruvate/2-oxoacid:ferredoxin oxidoreductase delta subunit
MLAVRDLREFGQGRIADDSLDKVEVKTLEACTKCLRCEQLCPDFAIVAHGEPGKSTAAVVKE